MSLLFGWCMLGGIHEKCPETIKRMWYEKSRRKRGEPQVDVVVYGETIECECKCHTKKELK